MLTQRDTKQPEWDGMGWDGFLAIQKDMSHLLSGKDTKQATQICRSKTELLGAPP